MAAQQNPLPQGGNISVPLCTRFAPNAREVIEEFLLPTLSQTPPLRGTGLIEFGELGLFISGQRPWEPTAYPYFHVNHFWLFVRRWSYESSRDVGSFGKWKVAGKATGIHSQDGRFIIGYVQKFDLVKDGLRTGWYQHEYRRYSNATFEEVVISHLVYDSSKRDLAPDHIYHGGPDQNVVGLQPAAQNVNPKHPVMIPKME
ncbi:PREDICTED: uncharacterized protein LOC109129918 [Camelina sativa]|uniref:Uncharacterized protein LOC109129918 n=1 Tax=Camelina sativa TaxID=90675 RepID=A0ABM1R668_CAMSA|nr:PREDICTED: uncharacterized protein LOC109129918 [Camelina sativa]